MPTKINLPNGCWCSALTVSPSNWKQSATSMKKKEWYISYRFYDPAVLDAKGNPKPKQCIVKGMNEYKDWPSRKAETESLIVVTLQLLQDQGLNPITRKFTPPAFAEIEPTTPILQAFKFANEKLTVGDSTKSNLKSILIAIEKAVTALHLRSLPIGQVGRKQLKQILERVAASNPAFTNNTFNHYRSHLSILFAELLEWDAVLSNPVRDMKKRKHVVMAKQILSDKERLLIRNHLAAKFPAFGRVVEIFYHSGIRLSELESVKVSDVDLKAERFMVLVKKGKVVKKTWREIKTIALPLWIEQLKSAKEDDFVIGPGCVPGKQVGDGYLSDMWAKWVKRKEDGYKDKWGSYPNRGIGTACTMYSLKHAHTTEVVDLLDNKAAAAHNGHTSTAMVDTVYDVKAGERKGKLVKMLQNDFVKKADG